MNAGESLGNKSAACDGYADENPIVMTTPQYTVSNVLCQTVDTETPYDRGANHNETSWGHAVLGLEPSRIPVDRGGLEAALLFSRVTTNAMQ